MGKKAKKSFRASAPVIRRRVDIAIDAIDYKNTDLLKKYVTEKGKILPRRLTGFPAAMHRRLTTEIKRARSMLLMK
ncbi:MAG: 30S ribosomal protein S18 [Verrucomicrobiota bacterium]|nr:30S ribosomal protein S18 [Verrucomicrobiota bacterium]